MKNISQATTAIRLTTIGAAVVVATAVMGGGYALAANNTHATNAHRVGTFTATLRYLVGEQRLRARRLCRPERDQMP